MPHPVLLHHPASGAQVVIHVPDDLWIEIEAFRAATGWTVQQLIDSAVGAFLVSTSCACSHSAVDHVGDLCVYCECPRFESATATRRH